MKLVGLSQRVDVAKPYEERRDAIDQKWYEFLTECGLCPVLIPNHINSAQSLLASVELQGIILTGGNNLNHYGGQAPERDQMEQFLLEYAIEKNIPALGVCRGMQVIQQHCRIPLRPVTGHVAKQQTIVKEGQPYLTNSYHNWGTTETGDELNVWARAEDKVVKAVRHIIHPMIGIMWHPERWQPFAKDDLTLFKSHFSVETKPRPRKATQFGTVYWVTGLSGAGKTTIGHLLTIELRALGRNVVMLDGDTLREVYGNDLGHSAAERHQVAMRNSRLCHFLAEQGMDVVCCTISMFHDVRSWNREHIKNYREIYLRVSLQTLKARDQKGLYSGVERGDVTDVYGLDLTWEEPQRPDIAIDNNGQKAPAAILREIVGLIGQEQETRCCSTARRL